MRQLAGFFPAAEYEQVLVGLSEPDDAAVYKLDDTRALITTTDFFTPVVDDPWTWGAIAAANAMSDVYAMGGEVLFCLNIAGFPEALPAEIVTQVFAGGAVKVREAGAAIAGGHTVTNPEPFYGLSVTGLVDPQRIMRKGGARPGDRLFLTKPLGNGRHHHRRQAHRTGRRRSRTHVATPTRPPAAGNGSPRRRDFVHAGPQSLRRAGRTSGRRPRRHGYYRLWAVGPRQRDGAGYRA